MKLTKKLVKRIILSKYRVIWSLLAIFSPVFASTILLGYVTLVQKSRSFGILDLVAFCLLFFHAWIFFHFMPYYPGYMEEDGHPKYEEIKSRILSEI